MAPKNSAPATTRSESIDVEGSKALALLGAWRGIYWFFEGRVNSWETVNPSEDNPEGGVIARGFTIDAAKADVNQLIDDISGKDRRVSIFPAKAYLDGAIPAPFTTAQEMTNFMVSNLKGSVEDGTAKTPAYVRTAVQDYKSDNGLKTRRGRKKSVIRLDNVKADDLKNISPENLQELLLAVQSAVNATEKVETPTS